MNNFTELWDKTLSDIELQVSRPNFITWFKNSQLIDKKGGVVIVGLPNNFVKVWIEKNYSKLILGTLRSLDDSIKNIEFTIITKIKKESAPELPPTTNENIENNSQLSFEEFKIDPETNLNPLYTIKSFIVGSSNDMAHAAASAVINSPGKKYNPLFIYGGVGVGKTHLIQAIGNAIKNKHHDKIKAYYISSEKFINDVVWAIQKKRMDTVKEKYRNVDLLIVDDIQFIGGKNTTQEEFFHTFNALKEQNKQVIMSSDKPPSNIPTLEERLRSRFEAGMVVDIGYPDYELKVAVLKTKLENRGIKLDDKVIECIAGKAQKNMRELEGILNKVLFYQDIKKIDVDIQLVNQIADHFTKKSTINITSDQILKSVANYYEISLTDLASKSRKHEFIEPRHISIYLLRDVLSLSFPHIAEKLGKKDHTTAIYAYEKMKKNIQINQYLNQKILAIKEFIERD